VKKSLATLLVVAFVLGIAGTALAFPVDFSGDVRVQYATFQDNITGSDDSDADHHDTRSRIRLNFSAQVDQDVTMFGRLGLRTTSGLSSQDPNKGLLDQYGVEIKANDLTYSVGRQILNLGQGSVAGFGSDVGYDAKFDGLVASGKLGAVDAHFAVGKSTDINSWNPSSGKVTTAYNAKNIWGIDFSAPLSSNFTLGATYATIKDTVISGLNAAKYTGVNMTFNPSDNFTLNGEYVKSNADTLNKAYFIAAIYSWDKDWFCIQYNNVQANGVDQGLSAIGTTTYPVQGDNLLAGTGEYTGFTYSYNHQMSKAAAFNVCYMSLKANGLDDHDNECTAGVTWSF